MTRTQGQITAKYALGQNGRPGAVCVRRKRKS